MPKGRRIDPLRGSLTHKGGGAVAFCAACAYHLGTRRAFTDGVTPFSNCLDSLRVMLTQWKFVCFGETW